MLEVTQKAFLNLNNAVKSYAVKKKNDYMRLAKGAALLAMAREFAMDIEFDDGLPKVVERRLHKKMGFHTFFDIIEENLSFTSIRRKEHLKDIIEKWFKTDGYPVVSIMKWYNKKEKTMSVSLEQVHRVY